MKKILLTFACTFFLISSYSQTLEKGTAIGFHVGTVKLNPDVTYNQWKSFMTEEWLPAINKEFEGEMKYYFLEGERGDQTGNFSIITVKSIQVRDKYWPEHKKSSEAFNTKLNNVIPVYNKLNALGEFKVELSTDWLVQ
jgi:hypothetical protein